MHAVNRLRLRPSVQADDAVVVPTHPSAQEQWALALCSAWFLLGIYLDGWAHNHVPELETFFTPWHGVLYSGFGAVAIALLCMVLTRRRRGLAWRNAVPIGYEYALIGVAIFLLGGIGDLLWHEAFGIESDIEALLSPTHLVLATGFFLMTSANVRIWLIREDQECHTGFVQSFPMTFSATCVLSILTFMMQFAHLAVIRAAGTPPEAHATAIFLQEIGIASALLQSAFTMGCLFVIVARRQPAFGTTTFILGLNMLGMGIMRDSTSYVIAAILSGLAADMFILRMYPLSDNVKILRMFGFAVPATFVATYFVGIAATRGIWWSVHLWAGTIVVAGIIGVLLSFIAMPVRRSA